MRSEFRRRLLWAGIWSVKVGSFLLIGVIICSLLLTNRYLVAKQGPPPIPEATRIAELRSQLDKRMWQAERDTVIRAFQGLCPLEREEVSHAHGLLYFYGKDIFKGASNPITVQEVTSRVTKLDVWNNRRPDEEVVFFFGEDSVRLGMKRAIYRKGGIEREAQGGRPYNVVGQLTMEQTTDAIAEIDRQSSLPTDAQLRVLRKKLRDQGEVFEPDREIWHGGEVVREARRSGDVLHLLLFNGVILDLDGNGNVKRLYRPWDPVPSITHRESSRMGMAATIAIIGAGLTWLVVLTLCIGGIVIGTGGLAARHVLRGSAWALLPSILLFISGATWMNMLTDQVLIRLHRPVGLPTRTIAIVVAVLGAAGTAGCMLILMSVRRVCAAMTSHADIPG